MRSTKDSSKVSADYKSREPGTSNQLSVIYLAPRTEPFDPFEGFEELTPSPLRAGKLRASAFVKTSADKSADREVGGRQN